MKRVVVVDYGVGNLLSVTQAFAALKVVPEVSRDPDVVRQADRLVLPGDGAFGYGMAELKARSLDEAIHEHALSGRPFLGICLGMQLMMDESDEFGHHNGLGLVPGRVTLMPSRTADGTTRRIPQVGWNALQPGGAKSWKGTILDGLTPGKTSVYFVHSYMVEPMDPTHRLADCDYDGLTVCAAIKRDSLVGCQFHPEKSGPLGLQILSNFTEM